MEPMLVAIIAIPLAIPAGAGIAVAARSRRARTFGMLCALAAMATVAFTAGRGLSKDTTAAFCTPQTAGYFQMNKHLAPFCRSPK